MSLRVLLLPVLVCAGLLAWSFPSLLIAKKVIGLLILPAGLVWLALMAIVCLPGLGKLSRLFAFIVLLFYTVAGNSWTGGWLLGKLEAPYIGRAVPTEPFDAVCVLGGGTSVTPDGRSQLGPAGDRLLFPARLYLKGQSRHLVTSGLSVTDIGGKRSLADDTAAVWRDLGIPETAITRLSEPRTTSEEIHVYRELISRKGWKRVGICSSAWHLRRVMNLCEKEGVEMIPVPADFLSSELPWTPLYAVPQSRGFQNVQKALWEYLGALAGN
ncbi:MAG: YdcF family protein [Verrucomicrobiaceae bacterium]|nr:MAG: YdcF family protein [Verrucomicrobiaceae bacterium]